MTARSERAKRMWENPEYRAKRQSRRGSSSDREVSAGCPPISRRIRKRMESNKATILADYRAGETVRQIASDHEVSCSTIYRYLGSWRAIGYLEGGGGALYIVSVPSLRYYKIGFTKNGTPERRLREMQGSNAQKLGLVKAIENQNMWVERACHKKLARFHVRGEWFRKNAALDMLIAGIATVEEFLDLDLDAVERGVMQEAGQLCLL